MFPPLKNNPKLFTYLFSTIIFLVFFGSSLKAQDSDELFRRARNSAFEKKNYTLAISFSKEGLIKSPDYNDLRIFLGRLYTWSGKPDSARIEFETVLRKETGNEDASFAYASLEYWNDEHTNALELVNAGLIHHSDSKDLLLLKVKILNSLNKYQEADQIVSMILKRDPKNTEVRAMSERIKANSSKNKIGINYEFVAFDKQFNDPWHLTSIDYGLQTPVGSVTARVNYANRFKSNGLQFEVDAYPRISPALYTYVSGGYSADGIFPNYRAGFSLFANLPASFEAEAGFRFLRFSDDTWVYTASLGKYYKNYWLNLRTYLTPHASSLSQSYSFNIRYYFGGADDYLKFGAATGLSPDESSNSVLIGQGENIGSAPLFNLKSNNLSLGLVHCFSTFNVVSINFSWLNQEFLKDTFGNQSSLAVGYQRRF
ncbi:YaiO family outer membrane beta-barrel protein [Pedobacter sp. P351]|uniref:YaiO family outer membrane beta-barrel protein n=1 Tax=Pedobacter superstes TaxID=3133441 RepID=UPI00309C8F41